MNHYKVALDALVRELPKFKVSERLSTLKESQMIKISGGSALYFLFNKGRLVYIGKSISLKNRLYNHCYQNGKAKWFDSFSFLPVSDPESIEGAFIKALRPELNKSKALNVTPSDRQAYLTEQERAFAELYLSL